MMQTTIKKGYSLRSGDFFKDLNGIYEILRIDAYNSGDVFFTAKNTQTGMIVPFVFEVSTEFVILPDQAEVLSKLESDEIAPEDFSRENMKNLLPGTACNAAAIAHRRMMKNREDQNESAARGDLQTAGIHERAGNLWETAFTNLWERANA